MATVQKKPAKAVTAVTAAPKASVVPAAPRGVSVMEDLASQLKCKPDKLLALLKTTVFRTCKRNEEFQMACMVAREYKLNPILKEIYAFPSQNGVVPIISIDGWIRIINSHPKFAGCRFKYEGTINGEGEGDLSCTCVILRTDRKEPIEVQEFYEECYRDTDPWNTMPRRMLRWKSLIQCARVAFGFAGIYDFDEGNDILAHEGKRVTKSGDFIDVDVKPLTRDDEQVFPEEPDPTEVDDDETIGDHDEPQDTKGATLPDDFNPSAADDEPAAGDDGGSDEGGDMPW